MPQEWVVLELSPKAEGEDPDLVRTSIQRVIRGADVYLPVSVTNVNGHRLISYLVDGYAFVRRQHPDAKYFKLEGSRYVTSVLSRVCRTGVRPQRVLACASEADIARFRLQIHDQEDQGIGVGDTVMITSGPYRQITAVIIEDIPEQASVQVHVKLRSKESLVMLPRAFLRLITRSPHRSFRPRCAALRSWLTKISPLVTFDPKLLAPVQQSLATHARLVQGVLIQSAVQVLASPGPCSVALQECACHYGFMHQAAERVGRLAPLFTAPRVRLVTIGARYSTVLRLSYIQKRLMILCGDVERIEKIMNEDFEPENVIIDGHQLAIRCATAPVLRDLTDNQGRPTGAIFGFLRCLRSYHKKFPHAVLTVVWDGSSQRRRKMYAGYKANRQPLKASFEIEFLKGVLSLLGVKQAWNPEEEADDVAATLVRGEYKGQLNVVVTSDRDFLQLVTETDRIFCPAVGAGKERMWTPCMVEQEYGVQPDKMVAFRAIDGDTSDNLPGAPGFGPKLVSKLLGLYGTIDGVFSSNLAGLTPAQYQKLHKAESQVRRNVTLMALLSDISLTWIHPTPDQQAATVQLLTIDVKGDLPVFFPSILE